MIGNLGGRSGLAPMGVPRNRGVLQFIDTVDALIVRRNGLDLEIVLCMAHVLPFLLEAQEYVRRHEFSLHSTLHAAASKNTQGTALFPRHYAKRENIASWYASNWPDPIGEPALLLIGYAAGSTYRPLETGEAASSIAFGGRPQGIRLNPDFTPGARSRQGLAFTQFELEKMYRARLPAGQAECATA